MKKSVLAWLVTILLTVAFTGGAWAARISGTFTNASGQSGRVYVLLAYPDGNPTGYGTSVASGGSYAIDGVRDGMYMVKAFIDTATPPRGVPNGKSPIGGIGFDLQSQIAVSGADVTVPSFAIQTQTPQPGEPPWPLPAEHLKATPLAGSVFLEWDGAANQNGIEVAEGYNVYYNAGSTFNIATATRANGSNPIPNRGYDGYNLVIPNLTNGAVYSFAVKAVFDGSESAPVKVENITVGQPAGTHTISGTVRFDGYTPTGGRALYIVANRQSDDKMFMIRIDNPSATQPFTIPVENGTYDIGCIYDKNGDNTAYLGDLVGFHDSERRIVTVNNANVTVPDMTLAPGDGMASVTTYTEQNLYFLNFSFSGQEKQVAHVVLNAKPEIGLPETDLGLNNWGFGYYLNDVPKPVVGDTYTARLTFVDNTFQDLTMEVTGLIDAVPYISFPSEQISGSTKQSPLFYWKTNGVPQGNVQYLVNLHDNNITNGDNQIWSAVVPADQSFVQYDGAPLNPGGNGYSWDVEIIDQFGNSAGGYAGFSIASNPDPGPTVTGISPAEGVPGTTLTITGSGFIAGSLTVPATPSTPYIPSLNQVQFNGSGPVDVTSATATQLVVRVPSGVSAGPIRVQVNGSTAASLASFTPLVSYDYFVTEGAPSGCTSDIGQPTTCNRVQGIKVEIDGVSGFVTSAANGNFKLTGIKAGPPYTLKFTDPASTPVYRPVYASRNVTFSNFSTAGSYTMFTPAQVSGWGVTTGNGVIRTRVYDKNGITLGGTVVRAFSTKYQSAGHYTVAYSNATTGNIDPAATSTSSDGKFWVLNVDAGDTVVVTAIKTGYQFNMRTFDIYADSVSEGRIIGTPLPTITGFTPTSALPGTNITITGTNFDPTKGNNVVKFSFYSYGIQASVVSATATQLVVTVPNDVQSGPISVTVNGVRATSAGNFSIPAPTISGFTPASGIFDTTVTITGTNFSTVPDNNAVRFNGNWAMVNSATSTQLVVSVPWGATTGKISVETPGGSVASAANFTVIPEPEINSLSPDTGPSGIPVTINGSFNDQDKAHYQVKVNGTNASITSMTANTLVFTMPADASLFANVELVYSGKSYDAGYYFYQYKLTVSITGSGAVNGVLPGESFSCAGSLCTAIFNPYTYLDLRATQSSGFQFSGWSGAGCSGTGDCMFSLDSDKNVTATFIFLGLIKNGSNYYSLLQAAYDAALTGNTIQTRSVDFIENLIFDNPLAVKIRGGYDSNYSTNTGTTKVDGSLKIRSGTVRVEKLAIK